jgi:hypothetical protein
LEAVGKFFIGVVLFIVQTIALSWAIATLWSWFVVPLGVQVISYAHAYGVTLLVRVLTIKTGDLETKENSDAPFFVRAVGRAALVVLLSLVAVGFGFIATLFM